MHHLRAYLLFFALFVFLVLFLLFGLLPLDLFLLGLFLGGGGALILLLFAGGRGRLFLPRSPLRTNRKIINDQ